MQRYKLFSIKIHFFCHPYLIFIKFCLFIDKDVLKSEKQRMMFDKMEACCSEPEMAAVYRSYRKERESKD